MSQKLSFFSQLGLLWRDFKAMNSGTPANTYEMGKFQELYGSLSTHIKHMFSHYDGANVGRLGNDWSSSVQTPTYNLRQDRKTTIARSIRAVDNDPHARGLLNVLTANIVGPGLRPYPRVKFKDGSTKTGINKILLEGWKRYNDEFDAGKRMTQADSQKVRFGEIFKTGSTIVNIIQSNYPRGYLGIANQIFNVLRLDESHDSYYDSDFSQAQNKGITVFGINMDKYSAPESYWIQGVEKPISSDFMRVDFTQEMAEQFIGIPWMITALKYLWSNEQLISDKIVSSRIQSMISLYLPQSIMDSLIKGSAVNTNDQVNWQPGSIMHGPDNVKPQVIQADDSIKDVLNPLQKLLLHAVGMTRGVSYQALTSDLDKVNMASGRINTNRDDLTYFILQKEFKKVVCQKDWNTFVYRMFLENKIPGRTITDYLRDPWTYCECQWRPHKGGMIDPYKESLAAKEQRQNYLTSLDEWYSGKGEEWTDHIDQIIDEAKYLKDKLNSEGWNIDLNEAFELLGIGKEKEKENAFGGGGKDDNKQDDDDKTADNQNKE